VRYTLRQLEVFVAVGRYQSASRAAEELGLSQSATSTALAELEKQFDVRLFDRFGKRLQLNELGHQLLPRAIELLDRAAEVEHALNGEAGLAHLHIGATVTIGNYLASLLVGEYLQCHPGSQIKLGVHNTATVIQQVAHFEIDFGLVEGDCQHPELEVENWVADELVIFAAPEHPLARAGKATLAELARVPWIVREAGSGTRQTFDAALRHIGSKLDIRLELEQTEAIKRAVESGLGVGCISRLALRDAFQRGSLVPIAVDGLDLSRQFHFVVHKQKFRTPGMQAFLQLCRDVAANVAVSDEIVLGRHAAA
jgi:DNA-binding transcriptional LysR family regulator